MRPGLLGRIFQRKPMDRTLIALETFPYPFGGGPVRKGERFEAVSDHDFALLQQAGKARIDDGTSDKGAIVPPEMQPKRKYKTRDMQA